MTTHLKFDFEKGKVEITETRKGEPPVAGSARGSASWCDKCKCESVGYMHTSGKIYVPGCEHDNKERRVWQLLKEIENHCPCGARPESLNTHPHVTGCPVAEALMLMTPNNQAEL